MLCHPERQPAISLECAPGYTVRINKTQGYGNAVRSAVREALDEGSDLVLADTDGYHPAGEIATLAKADYPSGFPYIVKPYRKGIGIQSRAFSLWYSALQGMSIRDATGGFYRLSNSLMDKLTLSAEDMTIHIELLNKAFMLGAHLIQYGYQEGSNDILGSKRTANYQWKLFKASLG